MRLNLAPFGSVSESRLMNTSICFSARVRDSQTDPIPQADFRIRESANAFARPQSRKACGCARKACGCARKACGCPQKSPGWMKKSCGGMGKSPRRPQAAGGGLRTGGVQTRPSACGMGLSARKMSLRSRRVDLPRLRIRTAAGHPSLTGRVPDAAAEVLCARILLLVTTRPGGAA